MCKSHMPGSFRSPLFPCSPLLLFRSLPTHPLLSSSLPLPHLPHPSLQSLPLHPLPCTPAALSDTQGLAVRMLLLTSAPLALPPPFPGSAPCIPQPSLLP